MRYALVSNDSGAVLAVVEVNYAPEPVDGAAWIADEGREAESGGTYDAQAGAFAPAPPRPEVPSTAEALQLALKAQAIRDLPDTLKFLDTAERERASILFPEWREGLAVEAGEVYRDGGQVFEVRQGHTTQALWRPTAPGNEALWRAR